MIRSYRRAVGGTLVWAGLIFAAPSLHAQETNTIGNPQLRDFELKGTKTVTQPAPAETETQTEAPPVARPAPAPPATEARPAPARPTPPAAERVPAAPREPAQTREAPAPEPAREVEAPAPALPTPGEVEQVLPTEVPPVAVPEMPRAEPAPAPAIAETPSSGFPWLYVGIAAFLALIAFGVARKLRGGSEEAEAAPSYAEAEPVPAPAPAPAPKPASTPKSTPAPAGGVVSVALRPKLELEFKPDRAAATLTDTSVQFELTIRNVGNKAAGQVMVQARMFNAGAGQESEIETFFAAPGDQQPGAMIGPIPPRGQVQFKGKVTLPKDQVREVTIQGQKLFIPMVAFNVLYQWDRNRTGQTSMSYLVGREAQTPSQKMGAFRLDLGPRLYRSVGQRQGTLAKVV